MARPSRAAKPGRALIALFALIVILYGAIFAANQWGTGGWKAKLGLDLEGGYEIVLQPVLSGNQKVTQGQLDQAVDVIRARVDGSGVSEAQVSTQGNQNIVVDLPGTPSQATKDLVTKAAQLTFRPVLQSAPLGLTPSTTATATGTATGTGTPTGSASTSSGKQTASSSPTKSTSGRAIPQSLLKGVRGVTGVQGVRAADSPTSTSTDSPTASATASSTGAAAGPTASPTDASDPNWVTPALTDEFNNETCSDLTKFQGIATDPAKPIVACYPGQGEKLILGPVELNGTDIKGASAALGTNSQGIQTQEWQVNLNFTGSGGSKFGKITQRLFSYGVGTDRNRFAVLIDGIVITAPTTQSAIFGGSAQISGNFTAASARALANQLKYGSLPLSFKTLTENSISPTLGKDQLDKSLLAGAIGLLLVVLYAFFQYRLLGLVTVASLGIASVITYGAVVYLGWAQGFRLTLAGVTGLIVSIGITADSFIVFFERVRDEVRDGRSLRSAVETGWGRARRTILAADSVSFLAAVVLYVLAAGSVQGFAFTLGLTTLIDVIIVFLFTHPTLALLARTTFFGGGHPWSGLDPERLGSTARKRGRPAATTATAPALAGVGSEPAVRASRAGGTIAARRAAAERAARRTR